MALIPSFTLALDPGHGAEDPGCTFDDFVEAEWVWSMAERVIGLLLATGWPLTLKLTRCDQDHNPSLSERAAICSMAKADFVMSLHANGMRDTREHGALGFRMYGRPLALDCCAAFIAALDRPGEYVDTATGHVRPMLSRVHVASHLDSDGKLSWKRRAWSVLHHHGARPSALFEYGYASNEWEREWLLSEEGQAVCAHATVEAVRELLTQGKYLN